VRLAFRGEENRGTATTAAPPAATAAGARLSGSRSGATTGRGSRAGRGLVRALVVCALVSVCIGCLRRGGRGWEGLGLVVVAHPMLTRGRERRPLRDRGTSA